MKKLFLILSLISSIAFGGTSPQLIRAQSPITLTNGLLAIPQANGSTNGYLSSTDWTTFNNKSPVLTFGNLTDVGTDGITVTGGTAAVIGSGTSLSQHVADTTHNGYLSSADWNSFHTGAGSAITALTGDVTAAGPGSAAALVASIQGVNVGTPSGTGNIIFSASPTFSGTVTLPSGSVTSSAWSYGGSTFSGSGVATFSGTTDSSSTSTGTLITAGGLGVAKKSFFGARMTISQASADWGLTVTSTASTGNNLGLRVIAGTNTSDYAFIAENSSASPIFTIDGAGNVFFNALTASTVPYLNASKILTSSAVTPTQLSYVDATSSIQTQLNGKQSTLTIGNLTDAGTDGITVTGGTGAIIGTGTSIAQHVADTTHAGYLASADWNTFNGKQSTVSFAAVGSSPSANGGGISSGVITLQPFDGTHPGLVTASSGGTTNFLRADGTWASPGGGITALTGDVTASGTGSVAATVAKIAGVSVGTPTGTGNVVFSASPTLSGTLTAPILTSGAANPASTGVHRLSNTEAVVWRNAANSADLSFSVASNNYFTFTGNVNLSTNSIVATQYQTNSANPASTGIFVMANNEGVGWRNQANSADLILKVDTSNRFNFGSNPLIAQTFISTTSNPSTVGVIQLGASDEIAWRNNENTANVGLLLASTDKPTFTSNFGFGGTGSGGYTFGAGANDMFFNSVGNGTLSSIGNSSGTTLGFYEGPGLISSSDGVGYIGQDLAANQFRTIGVLAKNFYVLGDNTRCFSTGSAVQTTNATVTKLWQNVNLLNSPADNNDTTAYSWEALVTARASVGTGTPAWSTFKVYGQTHREGSACVLDFTTAAPHLDTNTTLASATTAWACDGTNTNRTDLTVTGVASTTIDWTAYLCWNKAQ